MRKSPLRSTIIFSRGFPALLVAALWLGACTLAVPPFTPQPPPGEAGEQTANAQTPIVNAPFFDVEYITGTQMGSMAVFWFGQVDQAHNAADVRVGFDRQAFIVHVAVIDGHLWYDPFPFLTDLTGYDAVTLYLDDGQELRRLTAQLNWWEGRLFYQLSETFREAGWKRGGARFRTETGWRGKEPNDDGPEEEGNDRGWTARFILPFESLGLEGPPQEGATWRIALALHDRDAGGVLQPVTWWPDGASTDDSSGWGTLRFGLPAAAPPGGEADGILTLRNGLDGQTVRDGAVGGTVSRLCPGDRDFIWNRWGTARYPQAQAFNIQNEGDIASWPCFARYYVTFPLEGLPPGSEVLSATLTLHQFGNSGVEEAEGSLIQVSLVGEDWDPDTLSWNTAPPALENVGSGWVDPLPEFPGWPGVARDIDVSLAVQRTLERVGSVTEGGLEQNVQLRLALYAADMGSQSGKFFVASAVEEWNARGRPTLRIAWRLPHRR